jgi:hypothetical protein
MINLASLIKEAEVYQRFPGVFADRELRQARHAGRIQFYRLRTGTFYTEEQLADYIEQHRVNVCTDGSPQFNELENEAGESGSRSEANGSAKKAASGTATGMTPQQGAAVASLLERAITKKPR